MGVVRGENVVLYLYQDGVFKPGACGRSCTLDVQTEFVETTVSGSGIWASFKPTKNSFSGSFEGVVFLDEPGMLTLPQIRQLQVSQTAILMRFERTDEASTPNVYADEGIVYIKATSDTGTYNDVNTYSLELIGSGALTQIFTITPTPGANLGAMRYDYYGIGGETIFVDVALQNKYILSVVKDGIGYTVIVGGTPVGKEVRYTAADGEFEFAVPFENGEPAYVLYRDL